MCDPQGLPIEPVDDYIHWLRARRCSLNTQETYARHLAWLFTYLEQRQVDWEEVEFHVLTDFLVTFGAGLPPLSKRGGGHRSDATLKGASAAIKEFYEYQRIETGRGPVNLRLSRTRTHARANKHHFLAHVEGHASSIERNALVSGLASDQPLPQVIDFEADFTKLLAACQTYRDRLLLSSFYDLGLRVGAARGLHTGDLNLRRRRVTVTRRDDNPNGALSKRRGSFEVDEGNTRFFDLYREYLLGEQLPAGIHSDFVFVNLRPPVGRPMSYSNVYDLCRAIGRRAGIEVELTPHVLRHTHATALAKAGWTNAEIAARLGQRHASSADVYVHLANDDLAARMKSTSHKVWAGMSPLHEEP